METFEAEANKASMPPHSEDEASVIAAPPAAPSMPQSRESSSGEVASSADKDETEFSFPKRFSSSYGQDGVARDYGIVPPTAASFTHTSTAESSESLRMSPKMSTLAPTSLARHCA